MHRFYRPFHKAVAFALSERFRALLNNSAHPSHLQRHRVHTVAFRIRLVAAIFGVLTLGWIPFDLATFTSAIAHPLALARFGCAFALFAIAALLPAEPTRKTALAVLMVMLATPLALHTVGHVLMVGADFTGTAQINANLYAALPYIVIGGLCLFPLVAGETVVLSLPVFALVTVLPVVTGTFSFVNVITQCWVLMLLLGIAVMAGMIQTYYMDVLLKRANHDPLTGALTRRSGVEMMEFAFRLSVDKNAPLSVMFFDIDNFKSINDNHGHDAGDDALRQSVDTLHAVFRDADAVVRWGGEEFIVVMNDTPLSGAEKVVARLMQTWLTSRPDGEPLTASIGLAERQADDCETWEDMVELADRRMYAAKQSGKARFVAKGAYSPSPHAA